MSVKAGASLEAMGQAPRRWHPSRGINCNGITSTFDEALGIADAGSVTIRKGKSLVRPGQKFFAGAHRRRLSTILGAGARLGCEAGIIGTYREGNLAHPLACSDPHERPGYP